MQDSLSHNMREQTHTDDDNDDERFFEHDDCDVPLQETELMTLSTRSSNDEARPLLPRRPSHEEAGEQNCSPALLIDQIASPPPSSQSSESQLVLDATLLEAPIIHVMDRIEDEMEAHAYEDLVPLDVKLALEDKVFGWTHLTSSVIGHIVFTLGSYVLVFQIVSLVYHSWAKNRKDDDDADDAFLPIWLLLVRVVLSLWAAVASYRMVRRRRRVWFRAPYGSKAYKQDELRRRNAVAETDRSTALGRVLQRLRHRRVLKHLKKAETRFARKHTSDLLRREREEMLQPQSSSTHLVSTENDFSSGSDSNSSEEELETDTSYDSTADAAAPIYAQSSTTGGGKMKRRPSFHTKPTNRMQSIAHDQVLFPTIKNMPYAHGGFFGAAPFMLANPHWISILRHLMPDVYVEISRRVTYSPASRLIHWAENNPVVGAYGAAHELEYHNHIPNIEWDVFLDPALVRRVQIVLEERDKFLANNVDYHNSPDSQSKRYPKATHILAYYEQELKRRSHALVDKMLIAHGNLTQLITEQTGYGKHYNYSRVKRTRRTLGGGIYARQWIAVFAEALRLGVCYHEGLDRHLEQTPKRSGRTSTLMSLAESKCPDATMSKSIQMIESITSAKEPLGLVLDLKSKHVPKRVWSIVVDVLRDSGIRVEGIASFDIPDIRGVSEYCTAPVQEIIFFHSAGDLQRACTEGKIQNGDKLFFNGGSLLWDPDTAPSLVAPSSLTSSFDPQDLKRMYRIQPFGACDEKAMHSSLVAYKKRHNLSIGIYCQEFAIDEAAAALLAKLANERSDVYDLGFSWGGVNGITIRGICPGRFTATDGFWNQRYIGKKWDYDLAPYGMT